MSSEVILRVLQRLWNLLEPFNVPMAVIGGIAASAWRHVRATRDVDLLIGIGGVDVGAMLRKLADAGFRPKRQPPILKLGELGIIQVLYEPPGA